MTAKNDITGDELKSKLGGKAYEDGWERIFGRNNKSQQRPDADDAVQLPLDNKPEPDAEKDS